MKIIVDHATHRLLYASPDLVLSAEGASDPVANWLARDVTTATADLLEVDSVPTDWGTGYTTIDGVVYTRTAAGEAIIAAQLAQAKAAKNDEINAARLAANLTTFPYGGKQIACDTLSRSDVDGTNGYVGNVAALPPGWPGGWKATDNTYVSIPDVATWKAFYAAMVGQGLVNFAHAQDLKTQLAAAATLEQVGAIAW